MTGLVVQGAGNLPTQFKPEQTFIKQTQARAVIDIAKQTKDWDLLNTAIDALIENQRGLVDWWGGNVRDAKRPKETVSVTETVISADEAKEVTGFSRLQIHRMKKRLIDEDGYRKSIRGAAEKESFSDGNTGDKHVSDKNNDWYTPPVYIEAAKEVMGGIDLDPASSEPAQEIVQAEEYYTPDDDGLSQPWAGRVWMNPPYSGTEIKKFVSTLLDYFYSGEVTEAIVLTNNSSDTDWFHSLLKASGTACLTRGRINFYNTDGATLAARQGQCFFYLGSNKEKFSETFGVFGAVVNL